MLQYKVEWEGEDPDDTWYDAGGFINSVSKIKEFHDAYPEEARLPMRLQKWLEAAQREMKYSVLQLVPEDLLPVKAERKRQ